MCLHCGEADDERRGDIFVRQSARDENEYLTLPLGQLLELWWYSDGGGRSPHVFGDQSLGEARREQRLPAGNQVDGVDEPVGGLALSMKPAAPARSAW